MTDTPSWYVDIEADEALIDGRIRSQLAGVSTLPMRAVFSSYAVKIACDGDELLIPFVIFGGRDYQYGEKLEDIARKIADDLLGDRYAVAMNHCDVSIYVDEAGQDADFATACSGDDDPAALVAVHVERD